jgi:hypothetical protein
LSAAVTGLTLRVLYRDRRLAAIREPDDALRLARILDMRRTRSVARLAAAFFQRIARIEREYLAWTVCAQFWLSSW